MAGLFNVDLKGAGEGIGAIASGIGSLANDIRTAITGVDAKKQAELLDKLSTLEAAANSAQMEINKVEAGSSSVFVAGWRPALGWCFAIIIFYNYIISPLVGLIPGVPKLPMLSFAEISPILMGMLGLGTMRTVEKIQNAQGNH